MALACGEWDVDGLLSQIPGPLFRQWQEYFNEFSEYEDDLRMAKLKAFIGNLAINSDGGPKRKDGSEFKVADFMPQEPDDKTVEAADPDGANMKSLQKFLRGFGKQG